MVDCHGLTLGLTTKKQCRIIIYAGKLGDLVKFYLHATILPKYRKAPIISLGLIFVRKAFSLGLFSGELIFALQNELRLTIKTAFKNTRKTA